MVHFESQICYSVIFSSNHALFLPFNLRFRIVYLLIMQRRSTPTLYQYLSTKVVEPRGVEPLSEDQTTRASPSAVCVLTFPLWSSRRQDIHFSSFIKSHRPQSLGRLVPCLYDAGDLRRRRLRADDRRLSCESYVFVVVSSI